MKKGDSANPAGSVEEWLRRRLEPEPEVVERTIERSLAASSNGSRTHRVNWRRCAAASAVLLVVAVTGIYLFFNSTEKKETYQDITITNASGNVEVFYRSRGPEDSSAILGRSVHRGGRLTIFNHGRVIAAVQADNNPRYVILGGGS